MTRQGRSFPKPSFESWKESVEKTLGGADIDKKLVTHTLEGIAVKPLYTEADVAPGELAGLPGGAPYRRGTLAIGRSGAGWDIRPCLEASDSERFVRELREELGRGARSVFVRFDRATREGRSGLEPDAGSVVGTPCLSAAQLGGLFAELPAGTDLWLDAGGSALAVTACLVQALRARGAQASALSGGLGADPLGALARDGSLPCALDSALEQMTALAAFAKQHMPRARAITCSLEPHHDAGATAVQELAFAYATTVAYLRALCGAGMSVEDAALQLSFRFAIGSDLFMEVAKLRAFRQGFAQIIAASGGSSQAQRAIVHAVTSSRTKAKRDPWVNLLRETVETFAAATGGADAVTSSGFDRALGPSDELARRLAFNLQVILNEEAHVTQAADPAGGSYYVEQLTDELGRQAWALFQRIEHEGGMAKALCSGLVGELIGERARVRRAAIEKRKQAIVGVSEYADIAEPTLARPERASAHITAQRKAALEACSRDEAVAQPLMQARSSLKGVALCEAAIEVAGRGATFGQLACALAGPAEMIKIAPLRASRDAEPFEALRDEADAQLARTGKRPSVFLCNLGAIPEHKARAQFASGFLAAGGFQVLDNDGFAQVEGAAAAFAASGAKLAVICGTDAAYATHAEPLAKLLRARGAKRVVLAGRAGDAEARYREAGVSDFIFMGCDVFVALSSLLQEAAS